MKSYKIISASLALLLGWSGTALAQTEVDALRYSRYGVSGSARIQGIGGAQSALGADISTMVSNPAGLGLFRRSEFSISAGTQLNTVNARGSGSTMTNDQNALSIPQVGFVFTDRKGDSDNNDWRGTSIGISYSRLNNFNQRLSYNNTAEPPNTMVDYFADLANSNRRTENSLINELNSGITTYEGLAYGTYLTEFYDVATDQFTENAFPLYTGNVNQREEIQRKGSQNQLDIGAGASYRDKLYLGASLGIVNTNFEQNRIFSEEGPYAALPMYDNDGNISEPPLIDNYSFELRDGFTSRGTGLNLRVGIIARPVDALRFGLSIQTPTIYTITETYNTSLSATTLNPETETYRTVTESMMPGEFSYNLVTPFRATGGVAVFLSKYGFLTADLEYVNYSGARFSESQSNFGTSGDYFDEVNSRISDTYKSAVNFKVGAEGRYEVFRVRAGYAVSGSPYQNADFNGQINSVTLGAGIRLQNFYLDAAYVNSKGVSRYSPYTFSDVVGSPVIDLEQRQNTVMFTFGYNF
ncbi:OmpP1/FadL family transporter [Pontibacter harenae]|uniref:OmpP1/FadL family transporter n=1 Tax=Pontibacter harenae TaxID=2894083 RepID=UPI001E2F4A6D|nr:hypothetical protein [Pontibacter harenae]MCC9165246.1 hypothetical protein [Pontibacter harenae]